MIRLRFVSSNTVRDEFKSRMEAELDVRAREMEVPGIEQRVDFRRWKIWRLRSVV